MMAQPKNFLSVDISLTNQISGEILYILNIFPLKKQIILCQNL